MAQPSSPFEFRRLRRSDVSGYLPVVLQGIGKLERTTGLDRGSEATIRTLSRRTVWWLLGFLRAIGRPVLDIYVAAEGGRIVGTGTILWLPSSGYVAGMATEAAYRGRGIASRILALQREEVARRRKGWLALDVESENETAVRVYEKAGYREAGRFAWFARTGLPETGPVAPDVRPATGRELAELALALDAARGEEYRAALPASPRMLSHIQILVTGRRVEHRTWVVPTSGGAPIAVRASFDANARLGAYFVLPGRSPPSSDELLRAIAPATAWLRPLSPSTSFAVAPEPSGEIGPTLERLGFAFAVRSLTMVRPATASAGTAGPAPPGG